MPKSYNQKLKIMYIAQMLMEESDEDHPISTQEIITRLGQYGISAERKSIYSDIEALANFGMDVIKADGRYGGYYLGSRQFELAELKLLVDAVQASKFITGKKSKELIEKLETLTSKSNAGKLQRQVVVANRNKTSNESIYYSIDEIYTAMNMDRKITFQYFSWTPDKKQELRRDGAFYKVSPWILLWDDENYYLIAYDEESNVMKHYRVDKMLKLSVAEERREGKDKATALDVAAYSKKTFGMFAGEEETVVLHCEPELAGVFIDRFGTDIAMRRTETGEVRVRVDVSVSPQFFGWLAGLGKKVRIVSPEDVKKEYREWLENILTGYNE